MFVSENGDTTNSVSDARETQFPGFDELTDVVYFIQGTEAAAPGGAPDALEIAAKTISKRIDEVTPPKLFRFLDLPTELRELVIHYHARIELKTGTLKKCIHWDWFDNPCCVWLWPSELILCDQFYPEDLPDVVRPGFLPPLALVNAELRYEVTNVLLRTTDQITIKYANHKMAKIVPWLGKFLSSLSGDEHSGFQAVHALNFPHIHFKIDSSTDEVMLMRKCTKLWKVKLTFHSSRVICWNNRDICKPEPLLMFLNQFKLQSMVECESLKRVDLDGIEKGDLILDQLQTLKDFGKWLREGFERNGRTIDVRLHRRRGAYRGVKDEGEAL